MPSKPKKLAIEGECGGDYIGRLQAAGPRLGESKLSFIMRLAALRAGRAAVAAAVEGARNVVKGLLDLGIESNNVGAWLERLGYTRAELETKAAIEGLPPIREMNDG